MKKILLFALLSASSAFAQTAYDTLAIQDFETVPATPTWGYTGVLNDLQSGLSSASSSIPNTPLGIDTTQAWHVVQVSGGNQITYDNITIPPASYDSIRVNFKLAAMNLIGSTGGPDHLDYVLVEYSLDNGATWVGRLRVRGSSANNCFWAYDATAVAAVQHLPATETMFQASTTGLQVAEGYSFCEISFPGTISQVAIRITPRSSSTTDSWLIDNLVITGEYQCQPSSSSITETACSSYTSPSGSVLTTSGMYTDIIPNASGCDSTISIDLTVNTADSISDVQTSCGSYVWIDGNTYSASTDSATWLLTNMNGCDSLITLDLIVLSEPVVNVTQTGALLSADQSGAIYQWLDCDNNYAPIAGETNQTFTPANTGNYAVEVTLNGCSDTSSCALVDYAGIDELSNSPKELVKIVDLMGREVTPQKNVVLIYIYSDGTKQRVLEFE